MSSSVEQRLRSWRAVAECGRPLWLAEVAPQIIRELEAMLAAQGIDAAAAAETVKLGSVHESPVRDSECAQFQEGSQ